MRHAATHLSPPRRCSCPSARHSAPTARGPRKGRPGVAARCAHCLGTSCPLPPLPCTTCRPRRRPRAGQCRHRRYPQAGSSAREGGEGYWGGSRVWVGGRGGGDRRQASSGKQAAEHNLRKVPRSKICVLRRVVFTWNERALRAIQTAIQGSALGIGPPPPYRPVGLGLAPHLAVLPDAPRLAQRHLKAAPWHDELGVAAHGGRQLHAEGAACHGAGAARVHLQPQAERRGRARVVVGGRAGRRGGRADT